MQDSLTACSTGPRTAEGKATSSRNAVKHNLTSTRLTGADADELDALRTNFTAEWLPANETETALVHQLAFSQWRIERSVTLELQAFNDDHLDPKLLSLSLRYRNSAERAFYKALKELQGIRKAGSVSQSSEFLSAAPSPLAPAAHGAPNPAAVGGSAPSAVGAQFVSQADYHFSEEGIRAFMQKHLAIIDAELQAEEEAKLKR